ncbi:MAG: glycosyltransferase family 2 protein, partial [Rikenellaceae bacterium]|nr:glycosyltransferase family 2 protein [Rikenellaceae bacterium]
TIRVEPASVVYHLGGGTLAAESPRKTYLNFRNNLAMLYKNLSGRSLWWVLSARLLLDALSALVFLVRGEQEHFRAVWRAHRDFFRMRKELQSKRGLIQLRRLGRPSEIYFGSILWRYYTGRRYSPVR